jgi:hypothetical protein
MRSRARTLLALAAPLMLAACASIAPPQPPSLDLPKPPTDLRGSRKGDRVILTWTIPTTTTDRQTIRTLGITEICRGLNPEMQECGTPVGKVATPVPKSTAAPSKQKPLASFTDKLPSDLLTNDPAASATYSIEVLNTDGRGAGLSNPVPVPLIRTLSAPQNFEAHITSQGVVLSWTAEVPTPPSGVRYEFRIFRRRMDQQERQSVIGEVAAGDGRSYTFTDSEIEWQKTYEYHAETVTLIAQPNKPEVQVEGDDTPVVTAYANDVFPPAVPSGLQAVFSGPGQERFIDLVWAPVSDVDLAGYNLYRHTEGSAPVKINGELVKTPAYRDTSVEAGTRYFYAVTAVDLRGNESARSEEASEAVPQ